MGIKTMLKGLMGKVIDHGPDVLIGVGITGFFTAIIFAVTATPKAEAMIVEAEDEKGEELTAKEKVKACWKAYIPAAVTAVTSSACLIGAAHTYNVRAAELTTAYALSQAVIKRYDEKIAEIDGEDRAQQVKNAVHNDLRRQPVVQEAVTQLPAQNGGLHPFYDPMSNTPFWASRDILDKVEVRLNKRLYSDGESYVTANDLYDELNDAGVYPRLKHTSIGYKLGWSAQNGGIAFSMIDKGEWDDGTPCYIMGYRCHHEPDYI